MPATLTFFFCLLHQVQADVAAIAMEEVLPSSVADAEALAPEELYQKKRGREAEFLEGERRELVPWRGVAWVDLSPLSQTWFVMLACLLGVCLTVIPPCIVRTYYNILLERLPFLLLPPAPPKADF